MLSALATGHAGPRASQEGIAPVHLPPALSPKPNTRSSALGSCQAEAQAALQPGPEPAKASEGGVSGNVVMTDAQAPAAGAGAGPSSDAPQDGVAAAGTAGTGPGASTPAAASAPQAGSSSAAAEGLDPALLVPPDQDPPSWSLHIVGRFMDPPSGAPGTSSAPAAQPATSHKMQPMLYYFKRAEIKMQAADAPSASSSAQASAQAQAQPAHAPAAAASGAPVDGSSGGAGTAPAASQQVFLWERAYVGNVGYRDGIEVRARMPSIHRPSAGGR